MPHRLGPKFEATFTTAVVMRIVQALQRAYATAQALHDTGRGCNNLTFGFNLYQFSKYELGKVADDVQDVAADADAGASLTVACENMQFRLVIGEYIAACHRAGETGQEDINVSFPNNTGALQRMVEKQLFLPGMEAEVNLESIRKCALIHMGNAEDGLCALYFCIPERADDTGKIAKWAHAESLWTAPVVGHRLRNEEGGAPSTPRVTLTPVVPVEKDEKPKVERKKKRKQEE